MIRFILLLSIIFASTNIAFSAGIGSYVGNRNSNTVRIGSYNTLSNVIVVEYDTYGSKSGYYVDDGFGMIVKYDKNGNVISKYKKGQTGKTYLYDKYNHCVGFFLAVSKSRTMLYDKTGNPIGYFQIESDGLVRKYSLDGLHLNTYKNN